METLQAYDWPGNVRELMGAIEHACIVCDGNRLLPSHLPREILDRETAVDDLPAVDRLVGDRPEQRAGDS